MLIVKKVRINLGSVECRFKVKCRGSRYTKLIPGNNIKNTHISNELNEIRAKIKL